MENKEQAIISNFIQIIVHLKIQVNHEARLKTHK